MNLRHLRSTLLLGLGLAASAAASKPRCRLERIDPTELASGRLRAYANVVELEGDVVEGLSAQQFTLVVDGKARGHAEALTRFARSRETVDIVLLVEVAAQYRDALPDVRTALKDFLAEQSPSMKVMLMTFGSEVTSVTRSFLPAAALADPIAELAPDDDSGDVAMTEAIDRAIIELNKLDKTRVHPGAAAAQSGGPIKLPPRRLIVLVSDGLNAKMDRVTFKQVGMQAARAHIPIHSIAYSPIDARGPLLNLGDLSKRSGGSFRWAMQAGDIKHQLDTLADEVRGQYVLTFKSDLDAIEDHTFALGCGELRSNLLSGRGLPLSTPPRRALAWYWWLAIGLGATVVALYLIGLVLLRRQKRAGAGGDGDAAKAVRGFLRRKKDPEGITTVRAIPGPPVRRGGVLIAVTGVLSGRRFEVGEQLTIGRSPQSTIVIEDDPSVSRRHCEVRRESGGFLLIDLGSSTGTWVNQQRLHSPRRLADGDVVRLGDGTQFKFRVD